MNTELPSYRVYKAGRILMLRAIPALNKIINNLTNMDLQISLKTADNNKVNPK